ncbi:MAG: FAD binding domain-containing protein [Anaerolineales bacterium]|nr:FAD binding domain-containing protein [Anaerolineales bacterium]
MKIWNQYLLPKTIDTAMSLLLEHEGYARLIAGGTDLLLDIQQGRHDPIDTLIDITHIPELQQITIEEDQILLGSAVTHSTILENQDLQENTRCLVQACSGIGGSQVRNVATIGGNVAHALPAGDGSIALLALNAEARIISKDGERWELMENLFTGPGIPSFDPCKELLACFRFSIPKRNERTAFHRVMRPQGVAIAILNMAIWMQEADEGIVENIRIAVGPAGPVPFRARQTEDFLRGHQLKEDVIAQASEILRAEAKLRTSRHRATKEYRKHLLGYLLKTVMSK